MSFCRICLCKEPSRDLFELQDMKLNENGEKPSCEEIMLFCLGIQIALGERISRKLCEICYNKIIDFFNFKALAIKNDTHLKSIDSKAYDNTVVLDNNIKEEELSETQFSEDDNHNDQEKESLIYYAENIKYEYKQENVSDDVIVSLAENTFQVPQIGLANNQPKKKKGRPKKVKVQKVKYKAEPKKICEYCGKEVKDLKQHMRQHVPPKERGTFKCDICSKILPTKVSIKKHIQRRHFSSKHKCRLCGKMVGGLKLHMLVVHNNDKLPYECVLCRHRFLTSPRLADHMTVHTKDRPFQCEHCSQTYRTKIILSMHIRQVHEKERSHLCQFCSKSFFKKHHLQVHLRSHTKEKPYKCEHCGKNFVSSTSRRNHLLLHAGAKTYACTLCDMTFSVKSYLRAHMQSHTREKKYPCRFCSQRYHRSDHRKRHEFTAHQQRTTASTPASVL